MVKLVSNVNNNDLYKHVLIFLKFYSIIIFYN